MTAKKVCHLLIGPPGSGKSTLAQQMQAVLPRSVIVSTDHIRQTLYADATCQGHWPEIEAVVVEQILSALAAGNSVIYDATNAKRVWRMGLLQRCSAPDIHWVGWHLTTPLGQCHRWNQNRDRQVPETVINDLYAALEQFPPHAAEGFAAVYPLDPTQPLAQVQARLRHLERSITNRNNRTCHQQINFHRYSGLLDFDRLMHLISLLVQYPGIGDLHQTAPDTCRKLIGGTPTALVDPIDELCAVMAHQQGALYADPQAIAQDLTWLQTNGFLSPIPQDTPLRQPPPISETINPHPYSDWEPFQRLVTTLRFIAHHPFCWDTEHPSSLHSLITDIHQAGLLNGDCHAALRKDFERVLKPFSILPPCRIRRGYFIGSGILSQPELLKVANLLQAQAKNIQDPLALSLLETLRERLERSQQDLDTLYPVRAIANRMIIDPAFLPADAIAHHPEKLEAEIETGQLLELKRFAGVGRFDSDPDDFFRAWPLQIVFRNIGWYLGYEWAEGPHKGLLQFERLDRLFRGRPLPQQRSRSTQLQALNRLHRLQQACGGLYLGRNAQQQRQFLSKDREQQAAASMVLELWFTDHIFAFVSEGTQRFPQSQMAMSPRPRDAKNKHSRLFSLKPSDDPDYPHRLQVNLPQWSINDVDLRRWILGFGPAVKVITPVELQQQLHDIGQGIAHLYAPKPEKMASVL